MDRKNAIGEMATPFLACLNPLRHLMAGFFRMRRLRIGYPIGVADLRSISCLRQKNSAAISKRGCFGEETAPFVLSAGFACPFIAPQDDDYRTTFNQQA